MELWKDIEGYEGLYQVSNLGRIRSTEHIDRLGRLKPSTIRKVHDNGRGYLKVLLKENSKQKNFLVHRLVAIAFLEKPQNKDYINHKDGNKQNNRVDNLEWCNRSENMKHSYSLGLSKIRKCENANWHKLTQKEVDYIRKNAKPYDSVFSYEQFIKKFNVSSTTIKYICYGKSWKVDK